MVVYIFVALYFRVKWDRQKHLRSRAATSLLLLTYSYNARFKDKKENAFKLFFLSFFFLRCDPKNSRAKDFYVYYYIFCGDTQLIYEYWTNPTTATDATITVFESHALCLPQTQSFSIFNSQNLSIASYADFSPYYYHAKSPGRVVFVQNEMLSAVKTKNNIYVRNKRETYKLLFSHSVNNDHHICIWNKKFKKKLVYSAWLYARDEAIEIISHLNERKHTTQEISTRRVYTQKPLSIGNSASRSVRVYIYIHINMCVCTRTRTWVYFIVDNTLQSGTVCAW